MTNKQAIYLDNNATTRPYPSVLRVMSDTASTYYGNPSSSHSLGREAYKVLETCRQEIGKCLGIPKPQSQLVFTSGATESNNIVLRGRVAASCGNRKPHVICSSIEHASVYVTLKDMEASGVCSLTLVGVDKFGRVSLSDLEKAIRPKQTVLVAIILGHNEIGTIQDSKGIINVCRQYKGVHVHFDLTQMVGRYPLNFNDMGMHSASFSGHKFHGPRGVGGLYLKNPSTINTPLTGGMQEHDIRAGTENLPAIAGMHVALRESLTNISSKIRETETKRDWLQEQLCAAFPHTKVNGVPPGDGPMFSRRLYNTLSISLGNTNSQHIMDNLKRQGVCISLGSACSKTNGSKTLQQIGLSKALQQGTFRISLSTDTTWESCRTFLKVLTRLIA